MSWMTQPTTGDSHEQYMQRMDADAERREGLDALFDRPTVTRIRRVSPRLQRIMDEADAKRKGGA